MCTDADGAAEMLNEASCVKLCAQAGNVGADHGAGAHNKYGTWGRHGG